MIDIIKELHKSIDYYANKYAKRFRAEKDDLYNEGFIGVTKALSKFDPKKSKLITFASPYIKFQMLKFCNSNQKMKYCPSEELDLILDEDVPINDFDLNSLNLSEETKDLVTRYIIDEIPINILAEMHNVSSVTIHRKIKSALDLIRNHLANPSN